MTSLERLQIQRDTINTFLQGKKPKNPFNANASKEEKDKFFLWSQLYDEAKGIFVNEHGRSEFNKRCEAAKDSLNSIQEEEAKINRTKNLSVREREELLECLNERWLRTLLHVGDPLKNDNFQKKRGR